MAENGTNLGKAYVQIVPSAKGISGSISNVLDGESESAGSNAGKKIASAIKRAITAAGIGTIIKESLSAGAALQQSIGGVETLYEGAADAMKNYANAAYQYGLSANDYMEQSTSFAAALKQSLGGDVYKAAEAANTALADMADNAAKLGTPVESLQTAYQGFAKQNYTMLDNLKLGYGGTKTEMERLLKDAQKLSGVEYNIDNLSDVYEAIHVIQEDLGLTGVAAAEASTTFSGSLGAMKASLENMFGSLMLGENIGPSLEAFSGSVVTFLVNNMIPAVLNIVKALPGAIFNLISTLLPQLMQSGTEMIAGLTAGLQNSIPQLIEQALPLILSFTDALMANIDNLTQTGLEFIVALLSGVMYALPSLIEYVPQIIDSVVTTLVGLLPKIIESGIKLLDSLIDGIIRTIPALVQSIPRIIMSIVNAIVQHLPQIIQSGLQLIGALIQGLIKAIPQIIKALPQVVGAIWDGLKKIDWGSLGKSIMEGIVSGLSNIGTSIRNGIANACSKLLSGVKDFFGIHSPSALFRDEVGEFLALGLGEGFEEEMKQVTHDMAGSAQMAVGQITDSLSGSYEASLAVKTEERNGYFRDVDSNTAGNTNYGGVAINVYASEGMDVHDVAEEVNSILMSEIKNGRAVFG